MASIVNNPKYGKGHAVALSTKLSSTHSGAFKSCGYGAGDVFYLDDFKEGSNKHSIRLGIGKDIVKLKDAKGYFVIIEGSKDIIQKCFVHAGKTGNSSTSDQTELKETISMWIFKSVIENNVLPKEDDIINKLPSKFRELYSTVYYDSAIKQVNALKLLVNSKGYLYERQGGPLTANIYKVARKLTRKTNDNWNPADVWMIKKNHDLRPLYEAQTTNELNGLIAEQLDQGYIFPISLKQIEQPKARATVIDSAKLLKQINMDFSLNRTMLQGDSFNNFVVQTKSGFQVRGGYKGSGMGVNLSLEGKMLGNNYQLGAVDAKLYPPYIKDSYGYKVRNGVSTTLDTMPTAKDELKQIFRKYGNVSLKFRSYEETISVLDQSDPLIQKRFSNLVSYMYSMLIVPKDFEDLMKYCYILAKKMSADSSTYILISH
jgi:hypothetical protein